MIIDIVESFFKTGLRLEASQTDSKVPRTIEYRKLTTDDVLKFPGWKTWTDDQFDEWYDKPYAVSIAGMKEFPIHSYNKGYSSKKVVMWETESLPKEVVDFFKFDKSVSKVLRSGWDTSYKTFESRIYSAIDRYNQGDLGQEESEEESPLELKAPWTHEKCTRLLKEIAPYYGFKVREDAETSFWTGFSAEGPSIQKLLLKWRDFTSEMRDRLGIEGDSQWSHEYQEGKPSREITTTLSYYYAPDWTFALVVKEKVYLQDRKVWFSLWFEKI